MDQQKQGERERPTIPEAEVVASDRLFLNVSLRLRIGDHSYDIQHKNAMTKQIVTLDGVVVAEGGTWLHMQKQFIIPLNDELKTVVKLDLESSSRGLKAVSLKIGGTTIIQQTLKWSSGLGFYLAMISMIVVCILILTIG